MMAAISQKARMAATTNARTSQGRVARAASSHGVKPASVWARSAPRGAPDACPCGGSCPRCAQAKFRLAVPNDHWEREGDSIATEVARGANAHRVVTTPLAAPVPPEPADDEHARLAGGGLAEPGRPLDATNRAWLAPWFGSVVDDVRLHVGARADAAARALGARAYTVGTDVVVADAQLGPSPSGGRWLLAHEVAHVQQQRSQRSSGLQSYWVQRAGMGDVKLEEGLRDEGSLAGISVDEQQRSVFFGYDSTELRHDAVVDSVSGFAAVQAAVLAHGQAAGDLQQVTLHGYASEEGDTGHNLDLSGQRAVHVRELLIQAGVPSKHIVVQAHGADATLPQLDLNRRVVVELQPPVTHIEMPGDAFAGVPCSCVPNAQGPIAPWSLDYITDIAPTIAQVARDRGVPPLALAGAIAEEYETRQGFHWWIDIIQDNVLPLYPEWAIDLGRIPDFHNKAQNLLEHDIGNANIHVRTALEQVEAGRLQVSGSPPTDAQVNVIVDFLLEERGMVEASASVLAQGQELFGPYIGAYDAGYQDAVLIDFFNIGYDIYYTDNFLPALAKDPLHRPCPDPVGDGCQVLQSRDAIEAAYEAGAPP